ncbi:MAG: NeuD/PglB/VioB family sugar acetyltransferase [Cyclobacteriaceae bacterium]|jgi:sugar O-acyltransferase (sialic acid O-acetyltransferase NeuD family)
MEKLIIIGAGNVGGYLSYNLAEMGTYEILGFLDDDVRKHHTIQYGHKVLGGTNLLEQFAKNEKLNIVVGISSPEAKFRMVERISIYDHIRFPNLIAKNVWLSRNTELGYGVILYPGVSINYESKIENFVIMNMNCAIGHNCTIEQYSTLAPGVNLAGFTHLEQRVELGIGVSTKQGIRIGHSSVIGGQAMVIRNVDPHSVVVGVPGMTLRKNEPMN